MEPVNVKPKPGLRITILRVLSLSFVVILSITIFVMRDKISALGSYGYPGIFLISVLANSTILIPLPGVMITSVMGAVFDPFWVAVAAGSGAAIGELSGYLAGFGGQAFLGNNKWYERLEYWIKNYGEIAVFALAFIPNPLFDMAGFIAGALKMNVFRFLLWCTLGKILKMMIFAFGGGFLVQWFK